MFKIKANIRRPMNGGGADNFGELSFVTNDATKFAMMRHCMVNRMHLPEGCIVEVDAYVHVNGNKYHADPDVLEEAANDMQRIASILRRAI